MEKASAIRSVLEAAASRAGDDASVLAGWENFYVIMGSTAGGLTGLTFVVIALIRESMPRAPTAGLGAFVTPTVVHFGGVLAVAAFLSMPRQGLVSLSVGFAIAGIAGVTYCGLIAANMQRMVSSNYLPLLEDWVWNVILPSLVYGSLVGAALALWRWPAQTMYAVATLSLAMLFIGIRNAWDIAVWMTTQRPAEPGPRE